MKPSERIKQLAEAAYAIEMAGADPLYAQNEGHRVLERCRFEALIAYLDELHEEGKDIAGPTAKSLADRTAWLKEQVEAQCHLFAALLVIVSNIRVTGILALGVIERHLRAAGLAFTADNFRERTSAHEMVRMALDEASTRGLIKEAPP